MGRWNAVESIPTTVDVLRSDKLTEWLPLQNWTCSIGIRFVVPLRFRARADGIRSFILGVIATELANYGK